MIQEQDLLNQQQQDYQEQRKLTSQRRVSSVVDIEDRRSRRRRKGNHRMRRRFEADRKVVAAVVRLVDGRLRSERGSWDGEIWRLSLSRGGELGFLVWGICGSGLVKWVLFSASWWWKRGRETLERERFKRERERERERERNGERER